MASRDARPRALDMYPTERGDAMLRVRPRGRYGMTFGTIMMPTIATMSTRRRPGSYYEVLFACFEKLNPITWTQYPATQIAEETGLSTISVERALAVLEADKVVLGRGRSSGKLRRLNRNLFSKSDVEDWKAAQKAEPDPETIDSRGR